MDKTEEELLEEYGELMAQAHELNLEHREYLASRRLERIAMIERRLEIKRKIGLIQARLSILHGDKRKSPHFEQEFINQAERVLPKEVFNSLIRLAKKRSGGLLDGESR